MKPTSGYAPFRRGLWEHTGKDKMPDKAYIVFTYAVLFHDKNAEIEISASAMAKHWGWTKRSALNALDWLLSHKPPRKKLPYLRQKSDITNATRTFIVSHAEWAGELITAPTGVVGDRSHLTPVSYNTGGGVIGDQLTSSYIIEEKKKKKRHGVFSGKKKFSWKKYLRLSQKLWSKICKKFKYSKSGISDNKEIVHAAERYLQSKEDALRVLRALRLVHRYGLTQKCANRAYAKKGLTWWYRKFWSNASGGQACDHFNEAIEGDIVNKPKEKNSASFRAKCPDHPNVKLKINGRCPICLNKPEELNRG